MKVIKCLAVLILILSSKGVLSVVHQNYDLFAVLGDADHVGEGVVMLAECRRVERSPGCAEVRYVIFQTRSFKGQTREKFEIMVLGVGDQSIPVGTNVFFIQTSGASRQDNFSNSISPIIRVSTSGIEYDRYLVLNPVAKAGDASLQQVSYVFEYRGKKTNAHISDPSVAIYHVVEYSSFLSEVRSLVRDTPLAE